MIHVHWQNSTKTGKIIVRGTDGVFLFACELLPCDTTNTPGHPAPMSFYYQTQNCGPARSTASADKDTGKPVLYAVSEGVDQKAHPVLTVLYQEMYAENEQVLGTVDVTYNVILFKSGFFADSIMQQNGYGILLLCHASQNNAGGVPPPCQTPRIHFVNWRQSRRLLKQQVHKMTLARPASRIASNVQAITSKHRHSIANDTELAVTSATGTQWESSLYASLKHNVCQTFNLLR
jgi:hypothetical protein